MSDNPQGTGPISFNDAIKVVSVIFLQSYLPQSTYTVTLLFFN